MAKAWAKPFYNSQRWKATRKLVLRRDSYTCHDCGGRATEVHHIQELTPTNLESWDIALSPENLQSLCYACHSKKTGGASDVVVGFVFDETGHVRPG